MKKFKQILSGASATLLTFSSLMVFAPVAVRAATDTCTWTGSGGNPNFSTAGNWTGCDNGTVPESLDSLVFPLSATAKAANNDLAAVTFGSITFNGTGTGSYKLTGNAFSLSGGISNPTSEYQEIENSITLTANQTFTGAVSYGDYDATTTLSLGAFTLTLTPAAGNGPGVVNIASAISGSGGITQTNGYVSLSKDSTFTGPVNVSGGTLAAHEPISLGTSAGDTTVNDGASILICQQADGFSENLILTGTSSFPTGDNPDAKFRVTPCGRGGGGGGTTETYGSQSTNTDEVTIVGNITLGSDVTFGADVDSTVLTGAISGAHAINLLPGHLGKLVISSSANGSSTPNGTIVSPVFKKTLTGEQPTSTVGIYKNAEITIDGIRGDTNVENGGILKGSGTVGVLVVGSGSTVAPGNSPGCLSSGNLTEGGIYAVEIAGTEACTGYDQLKVTGTVDLTNGTLNATLFNSYKPKAGEKYTIISNDAADAVTGTFAGLAEGATVTVDGYVLKISYVGGDGNDVVLTVQTVPGTPDTGFQLIKANPALTLIASTVIAGALLGLGRRASKVTIRR